MKEIEEGIKKVFSSLDNKDYDVLMGLMADEIKIDFSALTEVPASKMTKDMFYAEVTELLPAFKSCERHLKIEKVVASGDNALAKCASSVSYRLNEGDEDCWGVSGAYYIDFMQVDKKWYVDGITFHLGETFGQEDLLLQAWEIQNPSTNKTDIIVQIAS